MKLGGKYNWKGQPERLVYVGNNCGQNGYWHQFEKVDDPGVVWCEVSDSDLHMLEETNNALNVRCFDNSDYGDRYTVLYLDRPCDNGYSGVGMSAAPFHPQGFGQHFDSVLPGEHLGKEIDFTAVAENERKMGLANEIKAMLREAKEEFEERRIYELLAQDNPKIAALLEEYNKLMITE